MPLATWVVVLGSWIVILVLTLCFVFRWSPRSGSSTGEDEA